MGRRVRFSHHIRTNKPEISLRFAGKLRTRTARAKVRCRFKTVASFLGVAAEPGRSASLHSVRRAAFIYAKSRGGIFVLGWLDRTSRRSVHLRNSCCALTLAFAHSLLQDLPASMPISGGRNQIHFRQGRQDHARRRCAADYPGHREKSAPHQHIHFWIAMSGRRKRSAK